MYIAMNRHIFLAKLSGYWLCAGFFTLLTLFVLSPAFAQTNVFVSASATDDSGDGTSWATAKKTIAAGVAAAGTNGTVFVKAGLYNTTAEFTIPAGVTVKGGYLQSSTDADTTLRNLPGVNSHWQNSSWCTIVSGAGNHRIATVNGTLDGCVVRYGFTTTTGGGLLIDGGTALHCVIMWCDAIDEEEIMAEGGGVYIRNNGTLLNCVVTECRGDNGSAVSGENGSLINNTITRNWPSQCGLVTDYDGNVYHTVQIGSQCWMKENLRTTHYADGTAIPTTSSYSQTVAYYHQNTNLSIVSYGLYYNWPAVMRGLASTNATPSGVQGVCPDGWHVPSMSEFEAMNGFVNSIPRYRCSNGDGYTGKAICSKTGWSSSSTTCNVGTTPTSNNASGFTAMPAGYRGNSSFSSVGSYAYFWTTFAYNSTQAYYCYYRYDGSGLSTSYSSSNQYARSVRCVKDPE